MSDEEDLKRLYKCDSEVQAQQAKQFFEENGIKVQIRGLDVGGSVFGGAVDDPDIEIFVRASDYEAAKTLNNSAAEGEDEPVPAWVCGCGEDVDEGFEICWSCGAVYGDDGESDGDATDEEGEAGE